MSPRVVHKTKLLTRDVRETYGTTVDLNFVTVGRERNRFDGGKIQSRNHRSSDYSESKRKSQRSTSTSSKFGMYRY